MIAISSELMAKPTIRTVEEQKRIARYIYDTARGTDINYKNIVKYWKYYNNEFDENRFEYLTKVGEYELPARLKHIPLQKHYIDLLVSQQARRPFSFSVYAIDKGTLKKKYNDKTTAIIDALDNAVRTQMTELTTQRQMLEMKIQEIEQMANPQPDQNGQIDPEMQQQAIQLQKQLPILKTQLRQVFEKMDNEIALKQDQIEEIERYHTYTKKDITESYAQKCLLKLRQELNIEKVSTANFRNQVVTGFQRYFVDCQEGYKYPVFEGIESTKVYYPKIDNVKWIEEGPWCAIRDKISYDQFEILYGEEVRRVYGDNKIKYISSIASIENNATFVSTPDSGAIYVGQNDYSYNNESSQSIERWRVYFKVNQRVRVKQSPNPYIPGKQYTHIIDPNKYLLSTDEYKYLKGNYISKSDKTKSYDSSVVDTYAKSKGDDVIVKYVGHVYEATIIDDDIIVAVRKKQHVVRNENNYEKVFLPVIGPTYSGVGVKPYSLIAVTMDLQDLYDIVHYHQELMLALSGAKGLVSDRSQKPDGMTDKEWAYQKKLGNFEIQTMDPTGLKQRNTSFNQWTPFDNTLSPSVQYLGDIKMELDETMGNIIGVPRPRQGQVLPSDQVGTFQQSLNQASLITEILYDDHDECERRALSQLLNLACRYSFSEEQILELETSDAGMETISIPKGLFDESYFNLLVANNNRDEKSMSELKQFAYQQAMKGALPFYQLISIYRTGTLKDVEKKVEYFTRKAEELMQQSQSSNIEQQAQAEKDKIQFTKELDMQMKEMELKVRGMEVQLNQAKMEGELGIKQQTNQLKDKEIMLKTETDRMNIQTEREIEGMYLEDESMHKSTDEKLRALELKINTIANLLKHKTDSEKNEITMATKVGQGPSKERIKD